MGNIVAELMIILYSCLPKEKFVPIREMWEKQGGYSLLDNYKTKIDEIKNYYIQFQSNYLEEMFLLNFKKSEYNGFGSYFKKGLNLIISKKYDLITLVFRYKLVSNESLYIDEHFNDFIPRCFNNHSVIRNALIRNDDDNVFSISKKDALMLLITSLTRDRNQKIKKDILLWVDEEELNVVVFLLWELFEQKWFLFSIRRDLYIKKDWPYFVGFIKDCFLNIKVDGSNTECPLFVVIIGLFLMKNKRLLKIFDEN